MTATISYQTLFQTFDPSIVRSVTFLKTDNLLPSISYYNGALIAGSPDEGYLAVLRKDTNDELNSEGVFGYIAKDFTFHMIASIPGIQDVTVAYTPIGLLFSTVKLYISIHDGIPLLDTYQQTIFTLQQGKGQIEPKFIAYGPRGQKGLQLFYDQTWHTILRNRRYVTTNGLGHIASSLIATSIPDPSTLTEEYATSLLSTSQPILDYDNDNWGGLNSGMLKTKDPYSDTIRYCFIGHIAKNDPGGNLHYAVCSYEFDESLKFIKATMVLHPSVVIQHATKPLKPSRHKGYGPSFLKDVLYPQNFLLGKDCSTITIPIGVMDAYQALATITYPFTYPPDMNSQDVQLRMASIKSFPMLYNKLKTQEIGSYAKEG